MNTKTYGQTLRATAEAIERSERIARYIEEGGAPPTEYGARVSWPWKFDIPGYEDARQYVQQRIEAMLPQLLQDAQAAALVEVQSCETELTAARAKGGKP